MTSINRIALRDAWTRHAITQARRNTDHQFCPGPDQDEPAWEAFKAAVRDFNTWLADIRAAAWEEGRTAGRSDTHDRPALNPYRTERPMIIDDIKPGQIWRNMQNGRRVRVTEVTQFCDVRWEAVDRRPGRQTGTRWGARFLDAFTLEQEATE